MIGTCSGGQFAIDVAAQALYADGRGDEHDEVVGQVIFTPFRVVIDGTEIASARVAAPILSKRLRSAFTIRDFNHPAVRLFLAGK